MIKAVINKCSWEGGVTFSKPKIWGGPDECLAAGEGKPFIAYFKGFGTGSFQKDITFPHAVQAVTAASSNKHDPDSFSYFESVHALKLMNDYG